jgi:signal transduction histidine kinase
VRAEEDSVRVCVHDDGIGGADPAGGSGLIGLHDRVGALAGRLRIESPAGHGTSLLFEIPLKAPTQVYDCERIRRRSWG